MLIWAAQHLSSLFMYRRLPPEYGPQGLPTAAMLAAQESNILACMLLAAGGAGPRAMGTTVLLSGAGGGGAGMGGAGGGAQTLTCTATMELLDATKP